MKNLAITLMLIPGALGFIVLLALLRGWILSVLWGWFVVPLGLVALSIPWAIGIYLIVTFLTTNSYTKAEGDPWENFFTHVFMQIFSLILGYIVVQFM